MGVGRQSASQTHLTTTNEAPGMTWRAERRSSLAVMRSSFSRLRFISSGVPCNDSAANGSTDSAGRLPTRNHSVKLGSSSMNGV